MFCLSMFIGKRQTLNGCSRRYHLDESTFISRGFLGSSGVDESTFISRGFLGSSGVLFHFISFSGKNHISKQNSPRWDAAKRGVISGAIMFAYVP